MLRLRMIFALYGSWASLQCAGSYDVNGIWMGSWNYLFGDDQDGFSCSFSIVLVFYYSTRTCSLPLGQLTTDSSWQVDVMYPRYFLMQSYYRIR